VEVNSSTFCVAPWFQARHDNTKQWSCCALIDSTKTNGPTNATMSWPQYSALEYMNSEYVTYVRQQLGQGNQLPECSACWRAESAGEISLRQRLNNLITHGKWALNQPNWVDLYLGFKQDWSVDYWISADLKPSNICNFDCVMCDPEDSTTVANSWNDQRLHPAVIERTSSTSAIAITSNSKGSRTALIQNAIDSGVRWLQILGGEPLIDRGLLRFLSAQDSAIKKSLHLLFVTNGSVDLSTVRDQLGPYKGITFVVSLEGVGQCQDYVRRHSHWLDIESNILKYQERYNNQGLSIAHTLQCLTVCRVDELFVWARSHDISVGVSELVQPEFLSLAVLPESLREKAQLALGNRAGFLRQIDYRPHLLPQLKQWMDFYDPDQTWREILPEWSPFL
jgi:organic radical activating enzyme